MWNDNTHVKMGIFITNSFLFYKLDSRRFPHSFCFRIKKIERSWLFLGWGDPVMGLNPKSFFLKVNLSDFMVVFLCNENDSSFVTD